MSNISTAVSARPHAPHCSLGVEVISFGGVTFHDMDEAAAFVAQTAGTGRDFAKAHDPNGRQCAWVTAFNRVDDSGRSWWMVSANELGVGLTSTRLTQDPEVALKAALGLVEAVVPDAGWDYVWDGRA